MPFEPTDFANERCAKAASHWPTATRQENVHPYRRKEQLYTPPFSPFESLRLPLVTLRSSFKFSMLASAGNALVVVFGAAPCGDKVYGCTFFLTCRREPMRSHLAG